MKEPAVELVLMSSFIPRFIPIEFEQPRNWAQVTTLFDSFTITTLHLINNLEMHL